MLNQTNIATKISSYPSGVKSADAVDKATIFVSNSFCTLVGFNTLVMRQIGELITYEDKEVTYELRKLQRMVEKAKDYVHVRMVYALRKRIKELRNKQIVCLLEENRFPTGLLSLIIGYLTETKYPYIIKDLRKKPDYENIMRWHNEPHKPRYYQQQMLDIAKESCRGVFEASVASGKTLVMARLIKQKAVDTLIIVPSRALLEQTYRVMADAFGKKQVDKVVAIDVKRNKKLLAPIRIATIQTLASLNKAGHLDKFLADIDMMIIDECHHQASATYLAILPACDHIYYRYSFSGTFCRNDSKTLAMYGFLSDVLYQYLPKQATAEGFISPVTFIMENLDGLPDDDYATEYANNYCGGKALLNAVVRCIHRIPKDDQILILVDRKETGGEVIYNFLKEHKLEAVYISGDNKKEDIANAIEKFNDKEIRILIGSTVIGEGVDINSTKWLLMCKGGKSIIQIIQAVGRCVRLHPDKTQSFVCDFNFRNTNYLENHCEQRLAIYQSQFAGEIRWIR